MIVYTGAGDTTTIENEFSNLKLMIDAESTDGFDIYPQDDNSEVFLVEITEEGEKSLQIVITESPEEVKMLFESSFDEYKILYHYKKEI